MTKHRELLKKYIRLIIAEESVDYLEFIVPGEPLDFGNPRLTFSIEELVELEEIRKEIDETYGK